MSAIAPSERRARDCAPAWSTKIERLPLDDLPDPRLERAASEALPLGDRLDERVLNDVAREVTVAE